MPRRTLPHADTSHALPSDIYRRLVTGIGPTERTELNACLAGSENLTRRAVAILRGRYARCGSACWKNSGPWTVATSRSEAIA